MQRELRTNGLDLLAHFTEGKAEWKQFETKTGGTKPELGPGCLLAPRPGSALLLDSKEALGALSGLCPVRKREDS